MFMYHARQRSKFSMSYHVQSRHSPRTKQIDLGFQCFSGLILWFPGCPSMDLKDQCGDHLDQTSAAQNRYFRRVLCCLESQGFYPTIIFYKQTPQVMVPAQHIIFYKQTPQARLCKVFVSCGIDMGEICQLVVGHLHPQVRHGPRMWLVRLMDWWIDWIADLVQVWIAGNAMFGARLDSGESLRGMWSCGLLFSGKGDWWYHLFSPYRTIQLLPCCLDWNSMTGLRGGFAKQHLNARRLKSS